MCGFSSDTIKSFLMFRVEFSAYSDLHFCMQMRLSALVRGDKEFSWPFGNANFYTWPSSFGPLIDVSRTSFTALVHSPQDYSWNEWTIMSVSAFGFEIKSTFMNFVWSRGDLRVDLEDGWWEHCQRDLREITAKVGIRNWYPNWDVCKISLNNA